MAMAYEDPSMLGPFERHPPLKRSLASCEWGSKRIRPLRIGNELCLPWLISAMSNVWRYRPTSKKVFGLRMPGGTLGGTLAGRVMLNVRGLGFFRMDDRT